MHQKKPYYQSLMSKVEENRRKQYEDVSQSAKQTIDAMKPEYRKVPQNQLLSYVHGASAQAVNPKATNS